MTEPRRLRIDRRTTLFALASTLAAPAAWAQSASHRPIRIIVGFGPGSANDLIARELARDMAERLLREAPDRAERHLARWLGSREELLKA